MLKNSIIFAVSLVLLAVGCKESGSSEAELDFTLRAPSDLRVTRVGQTAVRLTWSDANTMEESFSVERKQNNGKFAPRLFTIPNVTTAVDSMNLFLDSTYVYRVRALRYTDAGPYSNEAIITLAK